MDFQNREKATKKQLKTVTKIFIIIGICFALLIGLLLFPNTYVCITSAEYIEENKENFQNVDCIMVLGCGVKGFTPSEILVKRLDTAIALYKNKVAKKLVMSGDHAGKDYNEVGVMKAYAIKKGVPAQDIFMDHAGLNTYDSLFRIKNVFGCKKIVAVTQEYHLYRTVYLARCLEIDVVGVAADGEELSGQFYRSVREVFARSKYFFTGLIKPESTIYNGDKIDIAGDGNITNDADFEHIALVKNIKY